MKIPKYWGKGTAQGMDSRGKTVSFSCWGWSEQGEGEARRMGQTRAEQVLAKFLSGEKLNAYSYSDRPLREEIVQAITDHKHNELGLVTRNSYGALVLNATRAMFMDVDFDYGILGGCLTGWLGSLFGKKSSSREDQGLEQVRRFADQHRDLGIRVYRTCAGLRCLVTNQTFDPKNPSAEDLMKELECDPLYIRLCRSQECFRARLTPKPWRCKMEKPGPRYPFESAAAEQRFREWEKQYERASAPFTVCRLLERLGSHQVHPDIEPVLKLHDQFCLKGEGRALA